MTNRESLKAGFFQECEDLLETMSDSLARVELDAADHDAVNALFRAVHSIKGGAGAFGLDALVTFSHAFENLLDDIREDRVAARGEVMQLLYRAGDRMHDLVESEQNEQDPAQWQQEDGDHAALLAAISKACARTDHDDTGSEQAAEEGFVPMPLAIELPGLPALGAPADDDSSGDNDVDDRWRITFKPLKSLYALGNDPLPLIRALSTICPLDVKADLSGLPPLGEMTWDEAYLSWEITPRDDCSAEEIREIFEFVVDDCVLELVRGNAQTPDGPSEKESPSGRIQATPAAEALATRTPGDATMSRGARGTSGQQAPRQSIRVDLDRVDRLINLVGELVISEAMLSQSLSEGGKFRDPAVEGALGQLKQLASELQERIMAIRAQSVKSLFQRMSRIVREAGHATGKEVRLVTDGEATEVDKTVIERLADPLTHMLRNAIDHGIEPPETRRAAGKPPQGMVRMTAGHRSGQVIMEIADDGGGIDCDAVLSRAIERGLVSPEASLTTQETYNLLFEPGFSTAQNVSNLSGRGVGMDVVRSEIQSLGGRVSIDSTLGRGTTVTISLPLTLAVVEGMLVEVAGETLVVPSSALRETMRAEAGMIHRLGPCDLVLSMRGTLIPVFDLGASIGEREMPSDINGMPVLMVETATGMMIALTVDRILGQREVVIKGLSENYGLVRGIAAATVLGDGRIALIVDVDQLAQNAGIALEDSAARLTA